MDEIADLLAEVGLTEYESRAYAAAVSLGTTSLPDLASEAEIPQQRVYDVVDDLQGRGLVEVHRGEDGKRATAVPPEEALTALKEEQVSALESSVDDAIERLRERRGEVDPSVGYVTVVNHESSARRHVRQAVERAEWWLFCSLPVAWVDRVADELRAAVERGVTVRLLLQGEAEAATDPAHHPEGALVRHRPSADLVVAADREYAVFRGLSAAVVDRPALITHDPNLVTMFQRYSEQFWSGSEVLAGSQPFPRRYLEPWRALADVADRLAGDHDLVAHVEGADTDTGREGTWSGPIVDHEFAAERDADYSVAIPEIAQLVIEDGDEEVVVGGWDATLEDVAARGVELRRE